MYEFHSHSRIIVNLPRVIHLNSTCAVVDIHVFHAHCNISENMIYVISDKQKYISLVVYSISSS